MIQTFSPDHYALSCAARQDYADFYRQELPFRQELDYPPCGYLVNLIFSGNTLGQVKSAAERFAARLSAVSDSVEVLGPSPCPLARLRGKDRQQVLLKAVKRPSLRRLLQYLQSPEMRVPNGVTLVIDVDPLDMF